MRILYDGLIYNIYKTRPGGISNFFDQLISLVSHEHKCLLTSARPRHLSHPSGPYLRTIRFDGEVRPACLKQNINRASQFLHSSLFNPQIIHSTYYKDPKCFSDKLPIVYTAYDMIHERWASDLDPQGAVALLKHRCFFRADAIPCISNCTRNDLLNLYPEFEDKTSVIYLSGFLASDIPKPNLAISTRQDACHLLYIGDRKSYKNFTRTLLAFERVSIRHPLITLQVVGAPFNQSERDLIAAIGLKDKCVVHTDVTHPELVKLYSEAIGLVYPSLYEGFGIPIIEAMSLGTPVIASNTSSIPEVAGGAALLFEPYSIDSISDAMESIILNSDIRQDLSYKGLKRSLVFSWKRTAENYIELYESSIAHKFDPCYRRK
jgi:glycosyltransferase involved in cell wall biosynthesis